MNGRHLFFAAAFALFTAGFHGLYTADAQACTAPMYSPFEFELLDEDTPDCVDLEFIDHYNDPGASPVMLIDNRCKEDFELVAVDCHSCEDAIAASSGSASVTLEDLSSRNLDDGAYAEQVFDWYMRDQMGIVHTAYHYEDPDAQNSPPEPSDQQLASSSEGGCATDGNTTLVGCSTAGASLPMDLLILMALVTGAVVVRRRWADRQPTSAS